MFAAEWGDLTQLATAALVAQTGEPLPVAVAAVAALWSVTVLAVVVGSQAGRLLSQRLLNRVSAAVFTLVGLFVIGSAFLTRQTQLMMTTLRSRNRCLVSLNAPRTQASPPFA